MRKKSIRPWTLKVPGITQLRISLQSSLLVLCQSQASDSTDKLQGIHSIRSPHPTNLFLSISPHFASPSPSLANPFTHNAFSSITTSLFDDEDTNNACSSSPSPLQVQRTQLGPGRHLPFPVCCLHDCSSSFERQSACLVGGREDVTD